MKVIGAGFPKTGTKSFWHAMEILGYNHLGILTIFSPVGLVVKATDSSLYSTFRVPYLGRSFVGYVQKFHEWRH